MGRIIRQATIKNVWFWIFATISVALIVVSFIMPPTGTVDSSVLAASGELFGWATLATVLYAIDKGMSVKAKKGDSEIEVNSNNEQE